MYTIELTYSTGNSFGSHEETDQIALAWKDKELARTALRSIKEHDEYYKKLNGYNRQTNDALHEEMQEFEWYTRSSGTSDHTMRGYCFALELDDGSWKDVSVSMWCGYFEQLHQAQIVVQEGEEDLDCIVF